MRFLIISVSCLVAIAFSAITTRSKRQLQVYYVCGQGNGQYVSQYPCVSNSNGCGNNCNTNVNTNCANNCNGAVGCTNSCNGIGNGVQILPTSFYNSGLKCNSGCGNVNCNNFNGQWINGQYVAFEYVNNQYSPCGSTCCGNNNQFFNPPVFNNWNNQFWPQNNVPIGQGVVPTIAIPHVPIGQGVQPAK